MPIFFRVTVGKAGSDVVGRAYLHQGLGAPLLCALKRSDGWKHAEHGGDRYCYSMLQSLLLKDTKPVFTLEHRLAPLRPMESSCYSWENIMERSKKQQI